MINKKFAITAIAAVTGFCMAGAMSASANTIQEVNKKVTHAVDKTNHKVTHYADTSNHKVTHAVHKTNEKVTHYADTSNHKVTHAVDKAGHATEYGVRKANNHASVGVHRALGKNSIVRDSDTHRKYIEHPNGHKEPLHPDVKTN